MCYPQQQAIANTRLEYWCVETPTEQIPEHVPRTRYRICNFRRVRLIAYNSVPRLRQTRIEKIDNVASGHQLAQPALLALLQYRPQLKATIETIDKHPLLGVSVKFELKITRIGAYGVKRSRISLHGAASTVKKIPDSKEILPEASTGSQVEALSYQKATCPLSLLPFSLF